MHAHCVDGAEVMEEDRYVMALFWIVLAGGLVVAGILVIEVFGNEHD